jgi:hypothetical protein
MLFCEGRHGGPVIINMRDTMTREHLKIAHTKQARGANLNRIPKVLWELVEEPLEL